VGTCAVFARGNEETLKLADFVVLGGSHQQPILKFYDDYGTEQP